jgi:hypothetical protein
MASAVKPLGRSRPHLIPVKPDLVRERIRAKTDHFGGVFAIIPSRTGSNVGSRPDITYRTKLHHPGDGLVRAAVFRLTDCP